MENENNIPDEIYAVIFAGPNGSGKTSLLDEVRKSGLEKLGRTFQMPAHYINPDLIAKELKPFYPTQRERDKAAQDEGVRLRMQALDEKKSFAYETVMSHTSRIQELLMLKEQGYDVLMTFITTSDPEINVRRVIERFTTKATTGHYVEPEKVRSRYHRTMALLPKAAELVDALYVYDNSVDFDLPKIQAVIDPEDFKVAEDPMPWIQEKFIQPIQSRVHEVTELTSKYESRGIALFEANIIEGFYSGPVEDVTDHFIVQLEENQGAYVLHDRLILDTDEDSHVNGPPLYTLKERIAITYQNQKTPQTDHRPPEVKFIREVR